MESDYSLEALNNQALRGMSLKELEAKIHEGALANVPQTKLFDILMRWLNEQIKQDIITQSQHLLQSFVELLHTHSHADIGPFNLTQVDEVFNRWLEEDAVQNPAYRRRYLITQQDVHLLFSKGTRHFKNLTTPSLPDRQYDGVESHSPTLSCERDQNVKAEENANRRRNTGHGTPLHATQGSRIPTKAEIIEIDPHPSNELPESDTILSQHANDTYSQDPDADVAATKFPETITIDDSSDAEMRRTATRAEPRGRKYKVHDDLELSTPPKNYVCRRCHQPGHWIQHCPTNLDPRYDQAPARDYRCNFCGRKGDHFATLCSRNPHEGSLKKQREHAVVETREPQTPTRSTRRHYQHQGPPATRFLDRYRSHSPEQRSRSRHRSRTPEYRRPSVTPRRDYDSQTRSGYDSQRHGDESDVSPYTARARLTREFHMSSDNTKERGSSFRSWNDPFRFERRSTTPPSIHRRRSPSIKKMRRGRRDLDKVTKTDEGRLAYDDESEIGPKSSPFSLVTSPQRRMIAGSISREGVLLSALSSMAVVSDDPKQIETKADDFLRVLAAEILSKEENIAASIEPNVYEAKSEFDGGQATEDCSEGSDCSDAAIQSEPPAAQTSPPTHRLVQCPPFRPEIVSLFSARENPIVNSRANRKTACQMMKTSENFRTRHSEQV